MSKYTAADFANARFAECGNRAAHRQHDGWVIGLDVRHTDESMALAGWVPVPTKPTITESEYRFYENESGEGNMSVAGLLSRLGIEIIPNPEPTNVEKLADVYRDWSGGDEVPNSLIRFMDEAGVTAPEETK